MSFAERLRSFPKDDQLWILSRGGLPFADMAMRSEVQSALSNIVAYISGAMASLGFDSGVHLQADITCISPEGAKRVHDALRGGLGIARLSTKDNETSLLKMYDTVQIDMEATVVQVKAQLPAELADDLLNRLSKN